MNHTRSNIPLWSGNNTLTDGIPFTSIVSGSNDPNALNYLFTGTFSPFSYGSYSNGIVGLTETFDIMDNYYSSNYHAPRTGHYFIYIENYEYTTDEFFYNMYINGTSSSNHAAYIYYLNSNDTIDWRWHTGFSGTGSKDYGDLILFYLP